MMFLAREQANEVRLRSVPVIFVPGIMGSRLTFARLNESEDAPRDWDPDSALTMTGWGFASAIEMRSNLHFNRPAQLLTDGPYSNLENARGWGSIAADYYGGMLRHLQDELDVPGYTCPVYAFGYDWRQGNEKSAAVLRQFMAATLKAEGATEVMFVTHSMGGYVVRTALTHEWAKNKTLGVVHVAQPAGGAPVAYRRCFDGTSYRADGILMRRLMGGTPTDVFTIFTALPAALQLLPFDQARRGDAGDWLRKSEPEDKGAFVGWTKMAAAIMGYKAHHHPPSLAPEINRPELRRGATDEARANWEATRLDAAPLLTAANEFHRHLELRKHPNTWSLASTGVDTDERVCFEIGPLGLKGGVTFNLDAGRTQNGDGTVPMWSAFALDAGRSELDLDALADPELSFRFKGRGLLHDEICQDGDVQELTTQILVTMMTLPARQGIIEWGGSEYLSRLLTAGLGNRGAEMEIRVAKWAREVNGSHVIFNENPDKLRSHDLFIDGVRVEVKLCEGDKSSIAKQIRTGISQVEHDGKVIVVVGQHATESMAVYEAAKNEELADAFKKGPPGVVVLFLKERDLPPFIGKRAP